jgi:hypothetical protein
MASEYIATHSNRIYLKSEAENPVMGDMTQAMLAPVTDFRVATRRKQLFRQDKTGYRSESPVLGPQRELIEVALNAYGVGWEGGVATSSIGPVLESGFCAGSNTSGGGTVSAITGTTITFAEDTDLETGSAIVFGSEMRFVVAVGGPREVTINSPFTVEPSAGAELLGCLGQKAGDERRALSILDAWSPAQAVQRYITGVVADRLSIEVNNDFVEIGMKGYARRQYDNVSGNVGSEFAFPAEPAQVAPVASPIAGHLGQAVIGESQVCTLTEAKIVIDNNIEPRTNEFGCFETKAFVPGSRRVTLDFTVYERNDTFSQYLYSAAVNHVPVPVMFQLGRQQGAMLGVYLPAVLLNMPEFDDRQPRLLWRFQASLALGGMNDEVYLAQR